MSRRLRKDVGEWLDAERHGAHDLAEQALRRAFAELGRRVPATGFADRVLVRAGRFAPVPLPWPPWWLRVSVAGSLVAAALVIALLPAWWPVASAVGSALRSPLVTACSYWGSQLVNAGFAFWDLLQEVAIALQASLMTPTVLVVLAANVLLAVSSLFGLNRLLKSPEELMPW